MPLPADESVVKTAGDLVHQLRDLAGQKTEEYRPAHARGALATGVFTPTAEAASLSSAVHFNDASTPIIARFSSSSGIPNISDTDPNANPRGFAIRFILGEHKHTDIIAHSTPFFPTRTGAGFLEMLQAIAASATATTSPLPIEKFLGANPSALAFVQAPKPSPVSFATEPFYGVTAFKLLDASGKATYVRYRILPEAGVSTLSDEEVKSKEANYLFHELHSRLPSKPIIFKLLAQIADEGDVTDDATVHWPESRKVVELGTVKLEQTLPVEESLKQQKTIIFDPIPRIDGVEASDDPLLDMRAAVYLIGGKQRRAA